MNKIEVGILGATGMVGQNFIKFLQGHPWFEVTWLGASDRSAGKKYREACKWNLNGVAPDSVRDRIVEECKPGNAPRLLFSATDASVATEIEQAFANAGHVVVSNSKNHRMERDVPLLVPEINPDHLKLVPLQQRARGWKGQIVTNPNCSTVVLTVALGPLKQFGIERVIVTTMQAISGAGYPGVPSMDINANVIPFIGGEEEKMQQETQKILGTLRADHIEPLHAKVSAHCNRVPVVDGHTITVSVELKNKPSEAEVIEALNSYSSLPQERNLPSAPARPVQYMPESDRPQPRKDVERDKGMATFIGRLRPCPVFDYKFVALSHNTIRGAAGAAVLNAELIPQKECSTNVPSVFVYIRVHSWPNLFMIVMKFGGSSVESAVAIERVAGIVKSRADRKPVVVVSAMGKTTNKLLAIAQQAISGKRDDYIAQLHDLRDFHSREARLVVPLAERAELDRTLDEHFRELTELVKGLAVLGELTPRSIDAISSYGERLSSIVVTMAFKHFDLPAVHLDSRRVIVTDHRHTQAAPLFEETYARLAAVVPPLIEQGVVVMGGFIGATEQGVTTTLGRGGSDFTASIVGAGIDAEEIQIWTDVDGMLTADPTILPGGHRVKSISFAEAAELAYFGAKVLHPATVVPAVEKNIPVLILNSRRPDVPGTRIVADVVHCENVVKSIACKRKITLVNIHSSRMLMAHGFLRRIFEVFDRYETPVDMVATSEVSVSLTIDNTAKLDDIQRELKQFSEVSLESEQAIVCLVGENIRFTPGVASRAFAAMHGVNIRMISQGASLLNLSVVVADKDLRQAVESLHAEFFRTLDPEVFD